MLGIRKDIRRRTPSKAEQNRKGKTNQNCKGKTNQNCKDKTERNRKSKPNKITKTGYRGAVPCFDRLRFT